MTLIVTPQYGPGARREWTVRSPELSGQKSEATGLPKDFLAYARTWTGAQKAIAEITASLARLEARESGAGSQESGPLTQEAIDTRPRGQRPMGAVRQFLWNAGRAS